MTVKKNMFAKSQEKNINVDIDEDYMDRSVSK